MPSSRAITQRPAPRRSADTTSDAPAANQSPGSQAYPPSRKRPRVVARFEILSDDPAAGEAYRHAVILESSGRLRTEVVCTGRERAARDWAGAEPPTLGELGDLLVGACRDDFHQARIRLLSAVVHGLLPLGDHLDEPSASIPDALLDASLGFGPTTTYRADISRGLLKVLRAHPELDWALQVQAPGSAEHAELGGQIAELAAADPARFRELRHASQDAVSPFGGLLVGAPLRWGTR